MTKEILHDTLEIINTTAFSIYLAGTEHGAVGKVPYCQFTETYGTHRANYHTERK